MQTPGGQPQRGCGGSCQQYGGTLGHANSGTPIHMCACMTRKRGGSAPGLLVRNLSVCQATCCPNPTSEDTDPFPPPQGVTHPSNYRCQGPQREGSGCPGRRQQLCPAGTTQTVRGPGGAPHRTSSPPHPDHREWTGPGSAQSSGQSCP